MFESTSSTPLMHFNSSDNNSTGRELKDDDKVWGMPQFNENFGENLTDAEYLETVIFSLLLCLKKVIIYNIKIFCKEIIGYTL